MIQLQWKLLLVISLFAFACSFNLVTSRIVRNSIINQKNSLQRLANPIQFCGALHMTEIAEFEDESDGDDEDSAPKTHGYEGDFKVGDVVKVTKNIRIWSVKQYMSEGFDCHGFQGKVNSLVLYGRKHNTLCSAITPIKVEFQPDSPGIPAGMFERKFLAHFAADELELVSRDSS